MPVIEGTETLKSAVAEYDFDVDGGAVGQLTLRGAGVLGGAVPAGSIVTGGLVEVLTTATSGGSATVSIDLEGTADVLGATAVASLTAGRKSVIPAGTGATSVKTTAARSIKATIAVAALTAGKLRVILFYR